MVKNYFLATTRGGFSFKGRYIDNYMRRYTFFCCFPGVLGCVASKTDLEKFRKICMFALCRPPHVGS